MALPRRGEVLVVGSINVDLVVRVAHLAAPGETVTGGTFTQYQGGKGANQAVAAARLGARVTLVGAVGDDEFGHGALLDLAGEGIDVSRVALLSGVPTGLALIMVDERGENQIAVASGANARVDAAMVESLLQTYELPRDGVYLANLELSDEAVIAGARLAAGRGMRVSINPAPARELPRELLALGPILLPNQHEAKALTGEREPESAAPMLAARSGAPVIVTVGPAGAVVAGPDGVQRVPAPHVEVVDTTGAGDTFAGALAAELAAGSALLEATRVAVRAASMSVTVAGARGGMPSRTQLDSSGGAQATHQEP